MTFTLEYVPPRHVADHARRLAEFGIRLSLDAGPVLGGGLLTRAESGELPGKDVDLFFFREEELAGAHAALLHAGLQLLRHNPRSGTAVLGSDTGPAYDLVLLPGGTPQRVLAKNDIRACGLVSDGIRAFALEGAIEDAEAHRIVLLRQTDPRRLQSYLQRGWRCPALDPREIDIALRGEAIDGLTSHDLTDAQRYGHEPIPVRRQEGGRHAR
jgi:hypothetical protein